MSSYIFHANIDRFVANTIRYVDENALVLADCAKLAYESELTIKQAIQGSWKFKNFEFFDGGASTQGYVAGNDRIIIVAFRGTQGKVNDITADAKVKTEPGPFGKVHRGFNAALHEVWRPQAGKDMRSAIKKFQDNNQTVWFCGHSLGAALAALAAAEYVFIDKGVVNGLYTIGQPRVGNEEFAEQFDKILANRCFRFVNNNDIVPRVPLPGLVFKYKHGGHPLYFDSNGQLHDELPWWIKIWDKVKGVGKNIGQVGFDNLEDHRSEQYVALVKKNRSVTTQWS